MKFRLTGKFGELSEVRDHAHNGIDMAMSEGTTLRSITDGIVSKVFDGSADIGKGVAIKTNDGTTHIFGHMSGVNVQPGQTIHTGDIIGLSGNTGHSTAAHLHFGIQLPNGNFVDPTNFAGDISAMSGNIGSGNWFLDKYNGFSDWFIGKEADLIGHPIQNFLHDTLLNTWNWFIFNLPDIMGYGAILAGICIILGSMMGKGGMLKPLAIFAGAMIIALCILGGV